MPLHLYIHCKYILFQSSFFMFIPVLFNMLLKYLVVLKCTQVF